MMDFAPLPVTPSITLGFFGFFFPLTLSPHPTSLSCLVSSSLLPPPPTTTTSLPSVPANPHFLPNPPPTPHPPNPTFPTPIKKRQGGSRLRDWRHSVIQDRFLAVEPKALHPTLCHPITKIYVPVLNSAPQYNCAPICLPCSTRGHKPSLISNLWPLASFVFII